MQKFDSLDTSDFQSAFEYEIKLNPSNRFIHRLHCVQLVKQGCSCQQVADWFGENIRTIQRWVKYSHDYGIEGLKGEQKSGRPAITQDNQKVLLQKDIRKHPSELGYKDKKWDGKLLQTHLRIRYDLELGLRQCQRLLNDFKQEIADKEF